MTLFEIWKMHAEEFGYKLNTAKPGLVEKLSRVSQAMGNVCPCLPRERPTCPCDEMHVEIKETGSCYCKVFLSA